MNEEGSKFKVQSLKVKGSFKEIMGDSASLPWGDKGRMWCLHLVACSSSLEELLSELLEL